MGEKIVKPFIFDGLEVVDKGERRIRQMPTEILADKKKGSIFVTRSFVMKQPLLILHQK